MLLVQVFCIDFRQEVMFSHMDVTVLQQQCPHDSERHCKVDRLWSLGDHPTYSNGDSRPDLQVR